MAEQILDRVEIDPALTAVSGGPAAPAPEWLPAFGAVIALTMVAALGTAAVNMARRRTWP